MLVGWCLVIAALAPLLCVAHANDQPALTADKLLSTGQLLTEKTHYLEALDLLEGGPGPERAVFVPVADDGLG